MNWIVEQLVDPGAAAGGGGDHGALPSAPRRLAPGLAVGADGTWPGAFGVGVGGDVPAGSGGEWPFDREVRHLTGWRWGRETGAGLGVGSAGRGHAGDGELVGLLIFVYSMGYMADDENFTGSSVFCRCLRRRCSGW
jgi:hypothetical protein